MPITQRPGVCSRANSGGSPVQWQFQGVTQLALILSSAYVPCTRLPSRVLSGVSTWSRRNADLPLRIDNKNPGHDLALAACFCKRPCAQPIGAGRSPASTCVAPAWCRHDALDPLQLPAVSPGSGRGRWMTSSRFTAHLLADIVTSLWSSRLWLLNGDAGAYDFDKGRAACGYRGGRSSAPVGSFAGKLRAPKVAPKLQRDRNGGRSDCRVMTPFFDFEPPVGGWFGR